MNTKVKNGIIYAAVAVVCYLAGTVVGWPGNSGLLSGDIGKVSKYSKTVVDIDVDALQDRLRSDTAYAHQMIATVGVMQIHANHFVDLINVSEAQLADKQEFSPVMAQLKRVKHTATNSAEAINVLADNMQSVSQGKKVKTFEQDLNNALLAFNLVSQNSRIAERMMTAADQQLQTQLHEADRMLAALRNEWSNFAYTDAMMVGNRERMSDVLARGQYIANNDQLQAIIKYSDQDNLNVKQNQEQLAIAYNEEMLSLIIEDQEQLESTFDRFRDADQLGIWGFQNFNQYDKVELSARANNEQLESFGDKIRLQVKENQVDLNLWGLYDSMEQLLAIFDY